MSTEYNASGGHLPHSSRELDSRKHIAKMLNEVIYHCCDGRTDGRGRAGEREFPGKNKQRRHRFTSQTTERLRAGQSGLVSKIPRHAK